VGDRSADAVLNYCEQQGIGFIPWYPLAAGELARPGSVLDGIAKEASERQYPMSGEQAHPLPPVPRLQQFPENERFEFQTEERRLLSTYAWENKAAGTVRIPVADAMRLTVERGLPSRPAADVPEGTPAGMMPADSSSGRTLERRRQ